MKFAKTIDEKERIVRDKSDTDNIVKSYMDKGHYKWFDYVDPEIKDKVPQDALEDSLKNSLGMLAKTFGYDLKRVVIKDKGEVVGFLIWTNKGSQLDDLGDDKTYPVILATAIHPDYRNRGLLRMMISRAGIEKPYLVQTSALSTKGVWEKLGCRIVKKLGPFNNIEKCD